MKNISDLVEHLAQYAEYAFAYKDREELERVLKEYFESLNNNRWIPISERLPEVDKYGDVDVLVCMDNGFVATTTYVKDEGFELWADSGEVIAWMPLPEPYKPHETK